MCSIDDQHSEQGWGVSERLLTPTSDAEVTKIQNEEPGAGKPHAGICALSITHKYGVGLEFGLLFEYGDVDITDLCGGRPVTGVPTAMRHK